MHFCTDDHSISFETENANASAFKFFLNVVLNARSLCISVQMIILNLLKQRTQTPVRLNSFKRCSERSFAMYFCTDDHSKFFETENANASAFKFFLNVALNARSLCISVQMIILNLLKQRTQTPVRLNSFKRCSERSFAMYFCTDVHSKSFETENANASAFKFFFNVALNAPSLFISVQMILLNLFKQRTQTPVRLNSF